jgi:chitinase
VNRIFLLILILFANYSFSQSPAPALVGYWHNWQDPNAPYIQLTQIDTSYNIIEVSFAVPTSPSNMTMLFTPDVVTPGVFIAQIQTLHNQGKKVLISIGGATTSIDLTTTANKNAFINSMTSIVNTYGFDGIDLDIENGNSILITGGTIASPTNVAQINLIDAVKQIMINYRLTHPQKLMLTMAPETAYVQGGMTAFGSIWGGYLPIIHALRDSLDILQVQLYNSGSMYGIDGHIYFQATADFVISQTEAVIHGFNTAGGFFTGLPANKVAVGLPACPGAAGGGYTNPDTVKAAIFYLQGRGPKPAYYTKLNSYPSLRGMMTWSINWDANINCHPVYEYARNFDRIFRTLVSVKNQEESVKRYKLFQNYPNPFNPISKIKYQISKTGDRIQNSEVKLKIYDILGKEIATLVNEKLNPGTYEVSFDASELNSGVYFYSMFIDGMLMDTKKLSLIK